MPKQSTGLTTIYVNHPVICREILRMRNDARSEVASAPGMRAGRRLRSTVALLAAARLQQLLLGLEHELESFFGIVGFAERRGQIGHEHLAQTRQDV